MPVSVVTREYNGPYMTANATALKIAGDLEVSQTFDAANVNVVTDLNVGNAATVDSLFANVLTVATLDVSSNLAVTGYVSAAQTYANITTHGAAVEAWGEAGNNTTNSIMRAVAGSIWLGNASSISVPHGLDIAPNNYAVFATFCDASDTQQVVTPQVTEKTANSFNINCVPENSSETASISFLIQELYMPPPP